MFDLATKVLVVDDMATIRMLVVQCLGEIGFGDIVEATNGQAAWDLLSSSASNVGLILSDWNMPKKTGIDLVRLVRSNRGYAQLPFILITTESETPKVVEAVKAGVDDYIVKPFTLEVFRAKLEAVYKKKVLR